MSDPKVYVPVIVQFDVEGNITPISLVWEDGQNYDINRILEVRKAESLKAGGAGMRYTCQILGKETFLFQDFNDGKWFVERRKS